MAKRSYTIALFTFNKNQAEIYKYKFIYKYFLFPHEGKIFSESKYNATFLSATELYMSSQLLEEKINK